MMRILVLSESWRKRVYRYACAHTKAGAGLLQNLRLAALVTWDWHMILRVCVCVFILCAAGRTDDSSCASLPTRAALLPSNTDQTAEARRRVKCTLKPLVSLSLFFFTFFYQCIIVLVNTYCYLTVCFNQ